ncbi:NPCBM-associated, NEW3 domain of alpha-galactosidase [Paenibacillus sp. UNCCL117]|uniref:OmpL47-type beta-barrel domain-containing protein n=1 Tax=unclassified Paenibacillus TaxID=185978 RepID=UPI0008908B4D|nr:MULTISPECIES: sugar-binding protein [unclassified Paenibacillus]SDC43383.1 NPCBM-associated, NEW3 domain of alpha-galactosidase [Paenibacillus sp. cl123]SFW12963.1 NPCBM-associated, NEW3 domain of alpha-galactosidase [Paenibacillus sp. UNCCL117]
MYKRNLRRKGQQKICLLMIACLLGVLLPVPEAAGAVPAQAEQVSFYENFESATNRWDGSGWVKEPDVEAGSQVGVLSSSNGQYPTVRVKPGAWTGYADTNADYTYSFRARAEEAASGAPKFIRTIFRYDVSAGSAPNYYYFEVRPGVKSVYFGKYAGGVDTRLSGPYPIGGKLPEFGENFWFDYTVAVSGDRFALSIGGALIAEVSDGSYARGTIGFAVKNAVLRVDEVRVVAGQPPGPQINHTPPAGMQAGTPLTITASIYEPTVSSSVYAAGTLTAEVFYGYGEAEPVQAVTMHGTGGSQYAATIPASAVGPLHYYIRAVGSEGRTSTSPAAGVYTVPVETAHLAVTHTPPASVPYNADAAGTFALSGLAEGSTVVAGVYYRYGSETALSYAEAVQAEDSFSFVIPGTNQHSSVSYYIEARGSDGSVGRSPETGEHTYAVRPFVRYFTDFEQDQVGSMPVNWAKRGSLAEVGVYDDGSGNKVLRFASKKDGDNASAKLVHSLYQNLDHVKVKFRAKYVNRNPNPSTFYNLWRLRYRASDNGLYNTMEWSTHNTKYIMFRRTPEGGYTNGNYYRSAPDEWHTYEVEASGIHHRLLIDGEEVISFDDFSEDAPKKGFLQFDTVNGLELLIDDLEITPLPPPFTFYAQPSGGYAGIYEAGEPVGLDVTAGSGPQPQAFKVTYSLSRADGSREEVAAGSRVLTLAPNSQLTETIGLEPAPQAIGTYDLRVELEVDGVQAPEKTRVMRIALVRRTAAISQPDLEHASKFGFNTGYDPTWDDDMLDSVAEMGVRHARQEFDWAPVDRNNGAYDFSAYDEIVQHMGERGITVSPIMGIATNGAYDSPGVVDTPAALEALGAFTRELVGRYKGKIRRWEMPNEPELAFRPYIPQELVQVQKTFYRNMKQADFDAVLMAGDHTSGVVGVLPGELELGSYAYADAFSYHRYTYGVMPDGFIQQQTGGVQELVNELGGWKDLYVTESGWPTALAGYPSVSQEAQRDYVVRGFLIDMISDRTAGLYHFTWKNAGFDDNFYNTSFGITDGNGRPKLAYAALNTLMTTLDRALYAGKLDTGDPTIEAHVFLNRGEPVAALWKKVNYDTEPVESAPVSTVSLTAEGTAPPPVLTRVDVNGNESALAAEGGVYTLTVGGSPVYLTGLSPQMLYRSARTLLTERLADVTGKLQASAAAVDGASAAAEIAEAGRIHGELELALQSADPAARAAGIEQALGDVYTLMAAVADRAGSGSLHRNRAYVALEALYDYAERAAMSLAAGQTELGVSEVALDYAAVLGSEGTTDSGTARYAYEQKTGGHGLMPVSTSALMRANRYGRLAEQSVAEGDEALGYTYNVLARQFAGAVRHMIASEPVISTAITMSAEQVYGDIEAGDDREVKLTLTNRTSAAKTASLRLLVPDGWESVQTGDQEATLPIEGGAAVPHLFSVRAPSDAVRGIYHATVVLELDGVQTDLIKIRLNLTDAIGTRLMPVTVPIQQLEEVTVRLTGTSRSAKSGRVQLKGPNGTALEPVQPGGDVFELQPGQTKDLKFRWTDQTDRPFREYRCELTVIDTESGALIFSDDEAPLDFLLIQKAGQGLSIDGDLSDWKDAFPFHLRGAERNATGSYDPEDLDATAYLKWDEQNLYLAVKVTDDIHKASEPPSGIWKNDSIQVTLDPLNDKGGTYRSDDVDFGLALNDFRQKLGYVFAASPPNRTGDISTAIPFQIERSDQSRETVYEVQIPGNSIVHDLQSRLSEGKLIGFNVVVGDADFQEGRQNYVGWTKGIADSKNPGLYDSFLLVDAPYTEPSGDTEPPVTEHAVEGERRGEWYVSDALVSLSAEDADSGVSAVYYRLDEGTGWTRYEEPLLISEEGVHRIDYYAEDNAGNRESAKTAAVQLDRTGPNIADLPRTGYRQIEKIKLEPAAADPLSGVASVELFFDGVQVTAPAAFPAATLAPGPHTLQVKATDRAGHVGSRTFPVTVSVTLAELDDIIAQGRSDGRIRLSSVSASLIAKAKLAASMPDGSAPQLLLLLSMKLEIQTYAGSGLISAPFAALLQQDIAYLSGAD